MERFEELENAMCKELESIEKKISGGEMSETDLKRVDLLAHALKSMATYRSMDNPDEYCGRSNGGYDMYGREEMEPRYEGYYPPRRQKRRW